MGSSTTWKTAISEAMVRRDESWKDVVAMYPADPRWVGALWEDGPPCDFVVWTRDTVYVPEPARSICGYSVADVMAVPRNPTPGCAVRDK